MKIIFGLNKIKKFKNPVVAMGVFDGVHLGHIKILKDAVRKARAIKGRSLVLTFYPHPQKQKSLYSLKHRLKLISELGIDAALVIKFDPKFAKLGADNFVKDILVDKIGARFIYVGSNFRFGRRAEGNIKLLQKLSSLYNFRLRVFEVMKINRIAISSTFIRKLITQGKLSLAQKLLTRPVTVLGTVVKGISLARKLGFPTANIDPHHEILPPSGVYMVELIYAKKAYYGVCNIGTRPVFLSREAGNKEKNVEVYILNFNRNIYGRDLEIKFIRKIRQEKKFASLNLLATWIKKDVILAQKLFSSPQYIPQPL